MVQARGTWQGSVVTTLECRRRQIGAPVLARGRAHQHLHRHFAWLAAAQWLWMSREMGPEVLRTSVLVLLRYV